MLTSKAYKRMLAASVLTAVMSTGSVFAAEVQLLQQTLRLLMIQQPKQLYTMQAQKRALIRKIILMQLF